MIRNKTLKINKRCKKLLKADANSYQILLRMKMKEQAPPKKRIRNYKASSHYVHALKETKQNGKATKFGQNCRRSRTAQYSTVSLGDTIKKAAQVMGNKEREIGRKWYYEDCENTVKEKEITGLQKKKHFKELKRQAKNSAEMSRKNFGRSKFRIQKVIS